MRTYRGTFNATLPQQGTPTDVLWAVTSGLEEDLQVINSNSAATGVAGLYSFRVTFEAESREVAEAAFHAAISGAGASGGVIDAVRVTRRYPPSDYPRD